MVDYYISGVRHDDTRITHLEVRPNNNGKLGPKQVWSRMEVVNSIEKSSKNFKTVINKNGKWLEGQEVHVVNINVSKYLRTDKNRIAADNLGSLPPI